METRELRNVTKVVSERRLFLFFLFRFPLFVSCHSAGRKEHSYEFQMQNTKKNTEWLHSKKREPAGCDFGKKILEEVCIRIHIMLNFYLKKEQNQCCGGYKHVSLWMLLLFLVIFLRPFSSFRMGPGLKNEICIISGFVWVSLSWVSWKEERKTWNEKERKDNVILLEVHASHTDTHAPTEKNDQKMFNKREKINVSEYKCTKKRKYHLGSPWKAEETATFCGLKTKSFLCIKWCGHVSCENVITKCVSLLFCNNRKLTHFLFPCEKNKKDCEEI